MSGVVFTANTIAGLEALARQVADTPEGNRNHMLFWAACTAAEEGFESEDIRLRLGRAAEEAGLTRREVFTTLRSAFDRVNRDGTWGSKSPDRHEQTRLRYFEALRQGHSIDNALSIAFGYPIDVDLVPVEEPSDGSQGGPGATETDSRPSEPTQASRPGFTAVGDMLDGFDPADYPFLVDRMLRLGYRTILAAYESTGKTYIAMQLAIHFVEQSAAFGEFAVNEPLTVCYLDMEVGKIEALRRFQQLSREMGVQLIGDDHLRLFTLDDDVVGLHDPRDLAWLAEQAEAAHDETGRPVVLILDSIDSVWGKKVWGEEAEGLDDSIRALMHGRRDWLVVLTLAHTRKKPRDQKGSYTPDLQDVLGNMTRQADAVILLDGKTETSTRMDVFKRPGRSSGILQRDDGHYVMRWTKELGGDLGIEWKVKPAAILSTMSKSAIWTSGKLASELAVDKNTARAWLDALVEAGSVVLEVVERGRTRVHEYRLAPAVMTDD